MVAGVDHPSVYSIKNGKEPFVPLVNTPFEYVNPVIPVVLSLSVVSQRSV